MSLTVLLTIARILRGVNLIIESFTLTRFIDKPYLYYICYITQQWFMLLVVLIKNREFHEAIFFMFTTDTSRLDVGDICDCGYMWGIISTSISGCHKFTGCCFGICIFSNSFTWYCGDNRRWNICTVINVCADFGEYVHWFVDSIFPSPLDFMQKQLIYIIIIHSNVHNNYEI